MAVYRFLHDKGISFLVFVGLGVFSMIIQFVFVYLSDKGASIVKNDEFFGLVYMTPIYHLSSFLLGIYMAMIYYRYRRERGFASAIKNSFSSRALELIRNNTAPRYILYLVALSLMITSLLWQTPFVGKPTQ